MNPTEALHRACKQSVELDRARADAIRNGDWSRAWDLTDAIDRCNDAVRKVLAPVLCAEPASEVNVHEAA